MNLFPVGILVALASLYYSIAHLHQSWSNYFDLVAIFVVVGGTLAVTIITMPWRHWREIVFSFRALIFPYFFHFKQIGEDGLRLVEAAQTNHTSNFKTGLKGPAGQVLKDGAELITLGLTVDKIEAILTTRIRQSDERLRMVANTIRGLSKYPPAFGLIGTVLGLVSLMRAVSEGAGSEETGVRMAVALVATFYGLIVANLLVNPAGEGIHKFAGFQLQASQLALQAVLLAAERSSILEAQEVLGSYLTNGERERMVGARKLEAA